MILMGCKTDWASAKKKLGEADFLQQVKGCMINKYAHYLESVLLLFRVLALITCARAGDEYAAVRRGVSNALPPPHAQEISRCVPARVGVWLLRPLSRPQDAGA